MTQDTGARQMSKRETTRIHIMETYASLLDETPFDKVTVSRLCKEAGIVRSTFYTYYDDIYAVIQEIEDWLIHSLNAVDAHTKQVMQEGDALWPDNAHRTEWDFSMEPPLGFIEWFEVCDQRREALRALLGPNGDPYFAERLKRQLASHVDLLMECDGMPNDKLRTGFRESMVEIHLMLLRNWVTHERTSLTKESIVTILNALRVGGNTMGHYSGTSFCLLATAGDASNSSCPRLGNPTRLESVFCD